MPKGFEKVELTGTLVRLRPNKGEDAYPSFPLLQDDRVVSQLAWDWPSNLEELRETQRKQFRDARFLCNAEMGPAEVWKSCSLDASAKALLQATTQRLNLSGRAFHRILKVSRTIADLEGAGEIIVALLFVGAGLTGGQKESQFALERILGYFNRRVRL